MYCTHRRHVNDMMRRERGWPSTNILALFAKYRYTGQSEAEPKLVRWVESDQRTMAITTRLLGSPASRGCSRSRASASNIASESCTPEYTRTPSYDSPSDDAPESEGESDESDDEDPEDGEGEGVREDDEDDGIDETDDDGVEPGGRQKSLWGIVR